jgi:steroid delta-isomerase-like uncharacterized protein
MTDIEEIVREIYSAIDEWDVDSVMNYLADDFKIITVSNRVIDKHGFRDWFSQGEKAFPDRKITIERIMTKDNAAMVEFTWTATHTGEYLGYPATNNRIELTAVDILEFESGKVKYIKDVFNWRLLERGIKPAET